MRAIFCSLLVAFCFQLANAQTPKFSIGDHVQANQNLNVRSSPAGSLLGTQPSGAQGTITSGPVVATLSGITYNWYQVSWPTSPTSGWSVEEGLTKIISRPGSFTLSAQAYCNTTPPVAPAVRLTWTSSSGATSYDLYRNGTLYSSNLTGTSFDNTANVVAGQTYTYYVVAKNSAGTTQSNTVTVPVPSNICPTPQLVLSSVEPSTVQTRDWGESVTYTITVRDGSGNPVNGAVVAGQDNLMARSYQTASTNTSGQTTYTTTVPTNKPDGTYDITFIASKSGYTNSSTVTRQVQVTRPQTISARIDSYSPSDPNNPVQVWIGSSTTIRVTFTNTGNTAWTFIAGASVWDANGNLVGNYSQTLSSPLQAGQQTTVSWSHPVNAVGDYWLQFAIWRTTPFVTENRLDRKPSPSQRLIQGVPQPALVISSVEPSTIQTKDWGESVTYTITVRDGSGNPVSGAVVAGQDNLMARSYQTSSTNTSGQTTYTTTVPTNKPDGTYDITFIASKSGYTNSSTVTRQVQVRRPSNIVLTGSIRLIQSPPYSVGQTVTGTFSITNRGTSSVTFDVLTIGGRLNTDDNVRDFPWQRNITLSPNQTYTYQAGFTFAEGGSYEFFPAYRTSDGTWKIGLYNEIQTDAGVTALITVTVGLPQLVISSVEPSTVQTKDWGESVTYTITVRDGSGNAVGGAVVGGQDNLMARSYQTPSTNTSGQTTYTTTVPTNKPDGTYDITFIASKSGYANSSTVTRQFQVRRPQTIWPNPQMSNSPYRTGPFAESAQNLVGQCTWYVFGRIQETGLIPKEVLDHPMNQQSVFDCTRNENVVRKLFYGNACTWHEHAQKVGLATGTEPRPGATAIWYVSNNHNAFMESASEVTESNNTPRKGFDVIIAREGTRLRANASTSSNILWEMPRFTIMNITGDPVSAEGYQWYPMSGNGRSGWSAWLQADASGPAQSTSFWWNFTRIQIQPSTRSLTSPPDIFIYPNPRLISPANNSNNTGTNVAFSWVAVAGATYWLQVSKNSSFTDPVVNQQNLSTNSYYTTQLSANTQYWWRVNLGNPSPPSPWSGWTFNTGVSGTGTISVNATLNGTAWSGSVGYRITGPQTIDGSSVPQTYSNRPTGNYTVAYLSGGPSGATFKDFTPSATQTLTAWGTITFTMNFTSSQNYETFFTEASTRFSIPANLLKSIALVESGINQNPDPPSRDGGVGIMQLTGPTLTRAAQLLGVPEAKLSENSPEGARLNILGGAAVLRDFVCWASPRVFKQDELNKCVQGIAPYALTADEQTKLSQTLEVWWWPVAQYNGGGLDGWLMTTNYPFRVWARLKELVKATNPNSDVSYPPIRRGNEQIIRYLCNKEYAPDGKEVLYNVNEISSKDDVLYPTPADLGASGKSGCIRWVKGDFNPFQEVVLHNNDGSIFQTGQATLAVSPTAWTAPSGGGASPTISVTNSGSGGAISYTISTGASWLTTSAASETTPGSFTIIAVANNTGSQRTGTVVVTATTSGVQGSPQPITVIQQAAGQITLTVSTGKVSSSGQPVSVPITVQNFANVGSISLRISYNNSILTFTGIANAPSGTQANASRGNINISWFSTTPLSLSNDSKLLDLQFTYNGGLSAGGSTPIGFVTNACELTNATGSPLSVAYQDGKVELLTGYTVSGLIRYLNSNQTPISNATVSLTPTTGTSQTTTSSTDGSFSFSNVAVAPYTLTGTKTGNWGGVTTADALLVQLHVVGIQPITDPLIVAAADVNNSGTITTADALMIQLRVVGLSNSFPKGDWVFSSHSLSVSSSNVTQNVSGLCIGDINRSYLPSSGGFFSKQISSSSTVYPATISLKIATALVPQAGQIVNVPITVQSFSNVGSFTLRISYNSTILTFLGVINSPTGIQSNATDGTLNLSWFSTSPLSIQDGGKLLDLQFRYNGGLTQGASSLLSFVTPNCEVTDALGVPLSVTYQNGSVVTSVHSEQAAPKEFTLSHNYPNPFNPSTTIRYAIPNRSHIRLQIVNVLGQVVQELVNAEQEAGYHQVGWRPASGAASGIYFYRVEATALDNSGLLFVETKKMLLLR